MMDEMNQCDGCMAGIPVENGKHRMGKPGGYADWMACTASRYKGLSVLKAGKKAPSDLAKQLRELADAVDRDELTGMVGAYIINGEYQMLYGASLVDSLVLASLLQSGRVRRFMP